MLVEKHKHESIRVYESFWSPLKNSQMYAIIKKERGYSMSKVRQTLFDRCLGVLLGSPPSKRSFIKNH